MKWQSKTPCLGGSAVPGASVLVALAGAAIVVAGLLLLGMEPGHVLDLGRRGGLIPPGPLPAVNVQRAAESSASAALFVGQLVGSTLAEHFQAHRSHARAQHADGAGGTR